MEVRVLFRALSVEDEQFREPSQAPFFVSGELGFSMPAGGLLPVLNFTTLDGHLRASVRILDHLQGKGVRGSGLEAGESLKVSIQMGSPESKHSSGCPLGLQLTLSPAA